MARVLIVQGQARSRADTAATLRAEGHEVLEAGSADSGWPTSACARPCSPTP
jgi:hypothetical protein